MISNFALWFGIIGGVISLLTAIIQIYEYGFKKALHGVVPTFLLVALILFAVSLQSVPSPDSTNLSRDARATGEAPPAPPAAGVNAASAPVLVKVDDGSTTPRDLPRIPAASLTKAIQDFRQEVIEDLRNRFVTLNKEQGDELAKFLNVVEARLAVAVTQDELVSVMRLVRATLDAFRQKVSEVPANPPYSVHFTDVELKHPDTAALLSARTWYSRNGTGTAAR